eukprot:6005035-Pyramimonas_sp.AAC.1
MPGGLALNPPPGCAVAHVGRSSCCLRRLPAQGARPLGDGVEIGGEAVGVHEAHRAVGNV